MSDKPKTDKHPGGRPTKFNAQIKEQVKSLVLLGLTDKQVSEGIGITEQTFNNWKKKNPKYFESLKDWKLEADKKVVKSLYERAQGYEHPETKPQWVNDEDGGHWEYAEMTKHYPPDPTSMIFWLKNRQPEQWRDKQEVEHSGAQTLKVIYEDAPPSEED